MTLFGQYYNVSKFILQKKKAFFFAWPTPKHSMAVLTSFGNPLILAFAKIVFFSGKICQAASSRNAMWLDYFWG